MASNVREHFISMNISSNFAGGDIISLAWQTAMTSFLPDIQIMLFGDPENLCLSIFLISYVIS